MPNFEFDESEHTEETPVKWWECLDDTSAWVRFNYDEIMRDGSDELKRAATIVLNGFPPARYKKEETA